MSSEPGSARALTEGEVFQLLRGKGKPWLFVTIAVLFASSADQTRQLLQWVVGRTNMPRPLPPPPALCDWLPLYRHHRSMQGALCGACGWPFDCSVNELFDGQRELSRMSRTDIRVEVEALSREEQEAILRPFIGVPFPPDDSTLGAMLDALDTEGGPGEMGQGDRFEAFLATASGQFYFRVWLPCWIMHREYPSRLLRRARGGELKALGQLLRLDKSVVHDPRIAEQVHQVTHAGTKRDRDFVIAALAGKPKGRLDRRAMRYGLAGLISQLAILMSSSVTAPEVGRLFDGIERVRTGRPTDPSIPAGEALTKAIQRHRTWPSVPNR